jgi:nucleotide-binding universal stress UspA family protein
MAEKILVPVDGSETMERTIQYACNLVKRLDGNLTLIHVVALPTPPTDPRPWEQAGEAILQDAESLVEQKGCRAERILELASGNPGRRIVKVARERDFNLIVIHARGRGKVGALLLGSVCDTVAHGAHCPVLIVRP